MKLIDLFEGDVIDKSTDFRIKKVANANKRVIKKQSDEANSELLGNQEKIKEIKKNINDLVSQRGTAMIKHVNAKYGARSNVGTVLDMLDRDSALQQSLKQLDALDRSGKTKAAAWETVEAETKKMFNSNKKIRRVS